MLLYTLYVGIGFDSKGNILPESQVHSALDKARTSITRLQGGLTETWAHGRSVECPTGEQTIILVTTCSYEDVKRLDDIAGTLRADLSQGSILRTCSPVVERFI